MSSLALTHVVAQPRKQSSKRPPVLILAHGVGSNERDLFEFAPFVDERLMVIAVRAPRAYQWGGFSWFDIFWGGPGGFRVDTNQAQQSWEILHTFIEQAAETYQFDPQQVYLAGFSQGAIISLGATLTRPDLVRGLAVMSGRWMPEIGPQADKDHVDGLPILVTHGQYDQVIPVQYGRAIRDYLQSLPVQLEYHEYPMQHQVSMECLQTVVQWLNTQLDQTTQAQPN